MEAATIAAIEAAATLRNSAKGHRATQLTNEIVRLACDDVAGRKPKGGSNGSKPKGKDKLPVWAWPKAERMARYASQPGYWSGKASSAQIERVQEAGGSPIKGMRAFQAAELYAEAMCIENGIAFSRINRLP